MQNNDNHIDINEKENYDSIPESEFHEIIFTTNELQCTDAEANEFRSTRNSFSHFSRSKSSNKLPPPNSRSNSHSQLHSHSRSHSTAPNSFRLGDLTPRIELGEVRIAPSTSKNSSRRTSGVSLPVLVKSADNNPTGFTSIPIPTPMNPDGILPHQQRRGCCTRTGCVIC